MIAYIEHIVVICLIAHVAILARGVLSNFHPPSANPKIVFDTFF